MDTPPFVSGLALSRTLYDEGVGPIMDANFPGVSYAAALIGDGSEVLGFDTPQSVDHDWGPRLQLFLSETAYSGQRAAIHETFRHELPKAILGYPTHFTPANREGTRFMAFNAGPVDHRVEIWTVQRFLADYMAYDPRQSPAATDWLVWPQQHLLGVTAGAVYHDGPGELGAVRDRLSYYPHDVWLYLLAAQWARIGQEEAFVGRAGAAGDELGSAVIAARLVHDIMQLCFLMARQYAPYPKWFGHAFGLLPAAGRLAPLLRSVLDAATWQAREMHLVAAYEVMAQAHNRLEITPPLEEKARPFHNRPYQVIGGDRFVTALRDAIADPAVAGISTEIGSIDQFSHSTDLRSYPALHKRLQSLYK